MSLTAFTPDTFYGSNAYVFVVYSNASFSDARVNTLRGIHPVIKLCSDVFITSSGATSDPFKVVEAY